MSKFWRSLSRQIHPQLPLSHRESDKLLSALTGSFRQHLDAAHPSDSVDAPDGSRHTDSNHAERVLSADPHTHSHSSAASTDRHLAAILTSPLLASGSTRRPSRERASVATISLGEEHHHPDPVASLQSCITEGSLTIDLAASFLGRVRATRFPKLSTPQRLEAIRNLALGRKTFSWLALNRLYHPESYATNANFLGQLCYFLVLEGRECDIWDWLKLDLSLPKAQTSSITSSSHPRDAYRWKDKLLEAFVVAKLYTSRNLEAVTDCLQAAESLREAAPHNSHLHWLSLYPAHAFTFEMLVLRRQDRKSWMGDNASFDDYLQLVRGMREPGAELRLRVDLAWMHLLHPAKPDAMPAYELLQEHFALSATERASKILTPVTRGGSQRMADKWPLFMRSTAAKLAASGHKAEAAWVRSKLVSVYGLRDAVESVSTATQETANNPNLNSDLAYTSLA